MHSKKIRVRASLLGLSTLLLSVAPIIALNCCGKPTSDATDTGEQIIAETTTAITTTIATTEPIVMTTTEITTTISTTITTTTTMALTSSTTATTTLVTTEPTTYTTTITQPIEEPTECFTSNLNTDNDDTVLLAQLINKEASKSWEGRVAVASTVINRMNSGYWGSTIADVVYAKGQFTTASRLGSYTDEDYQAAEYVLTNGSTNSDLFYFTGGYSDGLNRFKDQNHNYIGSY